MRVLLFLTEATYLKSEAMPFFFGRRLHETLGVPIGLVQVAVSGTSQIAWTPREVMDQMHEEKENVDTHRLRVNDACPPFLS